MERNENNIELRTSEIDAILGKSPNWIMRTGIGIICISVLILLVGSVFFYYPETISCSINITTNLPPSHLINKGGGLIEKMYVEKNNIVKKDQILAVIKNSANVDDVLWLKLVMDSISTEQYKNKVNIYDIPIAMITEQYMEYVNQMDKEDLNVVSEFLVMAATLLDIKSRMLLPKEVNEEGEEEDPRAELVEKLLEYKLFKYMSYELKDRQMDAEKSFYKRPTVPKEVEAYRPPVDLNELIGDTTLAKLNAIFQDVLKRQEEKVDPIRSKFGKIEKEEVSMSEKLVQVQDFLRTHKKFSFREMLSKNSSKVSVIVTFLVMLELIKTGFVEVHQESTFGDIDINVVKDPELIDEIIVEE